MNKKIFIFTGLTCAGKDTCQNYLVNKYGYHPIVSTTSRPIREGEIDGVNYHYVTKEQFQKMIQNDELVEFREYHTLVDNIPDVWYYGVEKKEIASSDADKLVVVLDSVGYNAFKKIYNEEVTMCWVNTRYAHRKHRCKIRGDYNKFEFRRRNKSDKERFVELPYLADHNINNNFSYKHLFRKIDRIIKKESK